MEFSFKKLISGLKAPSQQVSGVTVGIDIGGAAVKVVEIEETTRTVKLHTYGELQLGPYAEKPIGEVVNLDNKIRIEAVTDVMREAGVTGKTGALAMPLSFSFLTVLPIATNDQTDLASRIPVEARKYVPLPLPEVTLDWSVLPSRKGDPANTSEVLLAAIENKSLAEYRSMLSTIGLVGEPAEIEAFSTIRSLWRQTDTTLAIIDSGARSSKIYIVRNGNLERMHRVVVGGRTITQAIAQALNINFEQAEELKRSYQQDQTQNAEIYKAMVNTLNNPFSEFKRVIASYESRSGQPIARIVCAGGVAMSPYFSEYAANAFGHKIEIANPFTKVAYPAFMEDTLRTIGPLFCTAMGAALRRFQNQ